MSSYDERPVVVGRRPEPVDDERPITRLHLRLVDFGTWTVPCPTDTDEGADGGADAGPRGPLVHPSEPKRPSRPPLHARPPSLDSSAVARPTLSSMRKSKSLTAAQLTSRCAVRSSRDGGGASVMANQAALYARITAVEAALLRMEHMRRKHEDDARLIHEELTRLQIRHTALHHRLSVPTSPAATSVDEARVRTCEETVAGVAERLDAMVECVREVARLRTADLAATGSETTASHLRTTTPSHPSTNTRVLAGAPFRRGVT